MMREIIEEALADSKNPGFSADPGMDRLDLPNECHKWAVNPERKFPLLYLDRKI
jgi:hypothetical protein